MLLDLNTFHETLFPVHLHPDSPLNWEDKAWSRGGGSHALLRLGGKWRRDLHPGGWSTGGGVEASALTDIQYTQLMPQTGNSNNIICAGGAHIYYPICPTGGGGKDQHGRQQQRPCQEFQKMHLWNSRERQKRDEGTGGINY